MGGDGFYCSFTAGDTHSSPAQSSCAREMPTERSHSDDYPIICQRRQLRRCGGRTGGNERRVEYKINKYMNKTNVEQRTGGLTVLTTWETKLEDVGVGVKLAEERN